MSFTSHSRCVFACLVDVQCSDVTVYVIVTDAFMVMVYCRSKEKKERENRYNILLNSSQ